jgi:hypothetical protein
MSTPARPATMLASAQAPEPIPFRKSGAVSGPEVFGSLVFTILLLAAFAGLAWFARRKGWLDRWLAAPSGQGAQRRQLAVLEVLNISRRTALIRVRHGERELLIIESAGSVEVRAADGNGVAP